MRVLAPMVSATEVLGSAVPVMAEVRSLKLTVSSPATVEIVGTAGATVSTVKVWSTVADELPARSVALAVSSATPWPISATSAAVIA